jgi:hypothetical protein
VAAEITKGWQVYNLKIRNILILLVVLAVAGGVYYVFGRPETLSDTKTQEFVWLIEADDIMQVEFRLPHENISQKFIKIPQDDQFPWFFDDANHTPVDAVRWSGGIPLLLSGPAADRKVAENATQTQLASFGLDQPLMKIILQLTDKTILNIDVGDLTPDGKRSYVRAPNSNIVATVDASWYELLAGLVKNPPYGMPAPTAAARS